jgi:hypothetical protein
MLLNIVAEWFILLLLIREVTSSSLGPDMVFLSSSRRMLGQYLKIRPPQLPSRSFPNHYSLITLSLDSTKSTLLKSVVKQATNKLCKMLGHSFENHDCHPQNYLLQQTRVCATRCLREVANLKCFIQKEGHNTC